MKSTFVILLHVKQNKMNIVILNAFFFSVNRNLSFFSTLLLTFSKPVSCEVWVYALLLFYPHSTFIAPFLEYSSLGNHMR